MTINLRSLSLLVLTAGILIGAGLSARADDTVDYGGVKPRGCYLRNACVQWVMKKTPGGPFSRTCLRYQMSRVCPPVIH